MCIYTKTIIHTTDLHEAIDLVELLRRLSLALFVSFNSAPSQRERQHPLALPSLSVLNIQLSYVRYSELFVSLLTCASIVFEGKRVWKGRT